MGADEPAARWKVGDQVLVRNDGTGGRCCALVLAEHETRPVVKVKYLSSRTAAWVARKRIDAAPPREEVARP